MKLIVKVVVNIANYRVSPLIYGPSLGNDNSGRIRGVAAGGGELQVLDQIIGLGYILKTVIPIRVQLRPLYFDADHRIYFFNATE